MVASRKSRQLSGALTAARLLRKRYEDFSHHNKHHAVHELLFIVCSIQTQEVSYRRTYLALRRQFPTLNDLQEASVRDMAEILTPGGLGKLKAKQLRFIFDAIVSRFGRLTLAPLKQMCDAECESFLASLPGIGLKAARCIMLYSFNRQVFPVDTHCWRIARRLGWIRSSQKRKDRCVNTDMDRLQSLIPPSLRFSLHVNFVSLGREYCLPVRPRCDDGCPIRSICPRKFEA